MGTVLVIRVTPMGDTHLRKLETAATLCDAARSSQRSDAP